jgi:hypothetical protein
VTRSRLLLSLVMAAAVGCSGSPGPSAPPTAAKTNRPPSLAPPSPIVQPPIVLRVDLSERSARWRRVLFVPFGPRTYDLGFKRFHEGLASQPDSFAVAPDGSFWILDRWRRRAAHYSNGGTFLDAISVSPDRGEDLVFAGAEMYFLRSRLYGSIVVARSNGTTTPLTINVNGRALYPLELYGTSTGLVARVFGWADVIRQHRFGGPEGFFRVDPGSCRALHLEGLPLESSTSIDLQARETQSGDQKFDVRYRRDSIIRTQPIRVELAAGHRPGAALIPAEMIWVNLLPMREDLAMYVMIAPSQVGDARHYGGRRWLLRLGPSPLLWERLPDPGISDEPQNRHLCVGSDGALYLMVAEREGIRILRRP